MELAKEGDRNGNESAAVDSTIASCVSYWDAYFSNEGQQFLQSSSSSSMSTSSPFPSVSATSSPVPLVDDFSGLVEWIASYDELEEARVFNQITFKLLPTHRILNVGCGSSTLGARLYDAGFHNIDSMDVSRVVIDRMKQQHAITRPSMRWWVGSCTDMSAEVSSESYDAVIDKGTSDTLQFRCKNNCRFDLLAAMIKEVYRILVPGGAYYCITPRKRLTALYQSYLKWNVIRIIVPVKGESRRLHKEVLLQEATSSSVEEKPVTSSSKNSQPQEQIHHEAYVLLCVKANRATLNSESEAEGGTECKPKVVKEAQLLLQQLREYLSSRYYPTNDPALNFDQVMSSSSLREAFQRTLYEASIEPGTFSQSSPIVCLRAHVLVKRKMGRKMQIYSVSIEDQQNPPPNEAVAPQAVSSSTGASNSSHQPKPLNCSDLEVLCQVEHFVDPQLGQTPSAVTMWNSTSSSNQGASSVSDSHLEAFVANQNLIRKHDSVFIRGFIGQTRTNEPCIFAFDMRLVSVGEERLQTLQIKADYLDRGNKNSADSTAATETEKK